MSSDSERVLLALKQGDFIVTKHATLRMKERGIKTDDIISVGRTHKSIEETEPFKFKINGLIWIMMN